MITHPRGNFYLKEADRDIFQWLAGYQYLEPPHVAMLSGRNIISVRRRLRQLHEHGLLDCIARPFSSHVYMLSGRGISLARELGLADEHARSNPEKSELTLAHDLFLTRFHLTLHMATKAAGGLFVYWEQRRTVLQDAVYTSRDRLSVNPDALFALKDDAKGADQNTSYFFLEYERTRPHSHGKYATGDSNFIRKARGFLAYHDNGRHTQRYKIHNFRVLTVTPTRERAENLCRNMVEADLAFKRFWFTDESHISLERPAEILRKIFFTPKDFSEGILYSFTLLMPPLKREEQLHQLPWRPVPTTSGV